MRDIIMAKTLVRLLYRLVDLESWPIICTAERDWTC
jgi:hypothetical protein